MDNSEFGEIYSKYNSRFVVIALRYVRDRSVAEDIVMDSFVSFWEHKDRLDDKVNHLAYLLAIIKNNCMNYLVRQQKYNQIEKKFRIGQRMIDEDLNSFANSESVVLFSREVQSIIDRQLEALPETTRKIFVANRFGNKTYSEIAEEMEISHRKVVSEIQKALSCMRVALKDYLIMETIMMIFGELSF